MCPRNIVENKDYAIFEEGEAEKFIATTGVERRRIVEKVFARQTCVSPLPKN